MLRRTALLTASRAQLTAIRVVLSCRQCRWSSSISSNVSVAEQHVVNRRADNLLLSRPIDQSSWRIRSRCHDINGQMISMHRPISLQGGVRCFSVDANNQQSEDEAVVEEETTENDDDEVDEADLVFDEQSYESTSNNDADYDDSSRPIDKLREETKRLLNLMDPNNSTDADIAKQRSRIDLTQFDKALEGWAKLHDTSPSDGVMAAESAESLLQALEDNYDRACSTLAVTSSTSIDSTADEKDGTSTSISWKLTPSVACYNFVLHSYATSGGGWNAAVGAQAILERMLQRCKKYVADMEKGAATAPPPPPPEPSVRSFNCVINAWSKCGDKESGKRAEEVFRMMEEWEFDCQGDGEEEEGKVGKYYNGVKPSVRSFSGVIDAWANSGTGVVATDRAMRILDQMIDKRKVAVTNTASFSSDDDSEIVAVVKPNVVVFNSVINTFAKNGKGKSGAEQAEELLEKMTTLDESGELGPGDGHDEDDVGLKPNTRSFSTILDAYARCANDEVDGVEAVSRAEALLERMEELYALDGFDVKPNYVCYTEVITALARCKEMENAAQRADVLLDKLIDLYEASEGDEEMKPTSKTFNSLITAHARSKRPDSAERAQAVFDKLCHFSAPDATSYASLIDAHAKSGKYDAGEKALKLLEQMEQDGSVEADSYVYNTTINALAQSQGSPAAAEKAVSLLETMEEASANGNEKLKPDLFSYTSTLHALTRSSSGATVGRNSRQILERLIERSKTDPDVKPDKFAFTTCINACASIHVNRDTDRKEKRECLIFAIQTFEDLKKSKYGEPNQFSYGAVIKACARLGDDMEEKNRLLRALFKECCAAGQLSKMALMWFKRGTTRDIKLEFFGELEQNYGPEGGEIIPSAWCRNVRKRDAPRHTSDHKDKRRNASAPQQQRQY